MTQLRGGELPLSQRRKKWRDQRRKGGRLFYSFGKWGLLHGQTEWELLPIDNTKLYTVKYIIRQGRRATFWWSLTPSEPNSSLLIGTGLCSQYSHASCECLYWKISCLSTWQTASFLSEQELGKKRKINSMMASQSVRTSMQHKQARARTHEQRMIHRHTSFRWIYYYKMTVIGWFKLYISHWTMYLIIKTIHTNIAYVYATCKWKLTHAFLR